jgi:hypothetical protein
VKTYTVEHSFGVVGRGDGLTPQLTQRARAVPEVAKLAEPVDAKGKLKAISHKPLAI